MMEQQKKAHTITANTRRLLPEDGLLLGNGDISVSVYPDVDTINFRFGKGDVWDRRFDYSVDPEPVDIDELTRGIAVERWKCGPYGGKVEALGEPPRDMERVWEICQGAPKSYNNIPYPCPAPPLRAFAPGVRRCLRPLRGREPCAHGEGGDVFRIAGTPWQQLRRMVFRRDSAAASAVPDPRRRL